MDKNDVMSGYFTITLLLTCAFSLSPNPPPSPRPERDDMAVLPPQGQPRRGVLAAAAARAVWSVLRRPRLRHGRSRK